MSDHRCLIIHCYLIENDNQFMQPNVSVGTGAVEIYPPETEGDRLRTHISGEDFSLVSSKVSYMLEVNDYAVYVNSLHSVCF